MSLACSRLPVLLEIVPCLSLLIVRKFGGEFGKQANRVQRNALGARRKVMGSTHRKSEVRDDIVLVLAHRSHPFIVFRPVTTISVLSVPSPHHGNYYCL